MKILSIGNSFSEDAWHHLSPMALECDDGFCHGNLVIGGCSLERHFNNLLSGEPSYGYQKTGHAVRAFSLKDGINDEDWDIVTLQQVSGDSGHPSTFFPYIFALADYKTGPTRRRDSFAQNMALQQRQQPSKIPGIRQRPRQDARGNRRLL